MITKGEKNYLVYSNVRNAWLLNTIHLCQRYVSDASRYTKAKANAICQMGYWIEPKAGGHGRSEEIIAAPEYLEKLEKENETLRKEIIQLKKVISRIGMRVTEEDERIILKCREES